MEHTDMTPEVPSGVSTLNVYSAQGYGRYMSRGMSTELPSAMLLGTVTSNDASSGTV